MEQRGILGSIRPQGTPQQLQKRSEHAIRLWTNGKIPAAIARAVSASRSSVKRWIQSYEYKRITGLAAKPIPGRPPQLSSKQKQKLEGLLVKGPFAAGYQTDLWTLHWIAKLIKHHFTELSITNVHMVIHVR